MNIALHPPHKSSVHIALGYAGQLFSAHGDVAQYIIKHGRMDIGEAVLIEGIGANGFNGLATMGCTNCGGALQSAVVNSFPVNLSMNILLAAHTASA